MPPQAKVTREMILDAAFEVVRTEGHEALTARRLAEYLHCSTQPVLYQFDSVSQIREETYRRADAYHTAYLTEGLEKERDPLLALGLRYIRFGAEEKALFRFLFQSGYAKENSMLEMIDSSELEPVLGAMQEGTGLDREKTRQVFLTVALFAHGYASIIANNGLEYDEDLIAEHLERAWNGAFLAAAQKERR
jgi:AcrR family transcriptional regulator